MIARVRGVTLRAASAGSMLNVPGRESTKIGVAPARETQPAVAKKFLTDHGVGTEIYYPLALHMQHCFAYLDHVREVCLEAYSHQDVPFEKVVEYGA